MEHSIYCLLVQDAAEERWGDATTDESDSELTHYRSKRAEALEASASVFADATEEYGSLAAVKDRLEKWKQQQPGAYADAYMSLSVPAVMAPFVRLELLRWDPLFGSSTGWHTFSSYETSFLICAPLHHFSKEYSCGRSKEFLCNHVHLQRAAVGTVLLPSWPAKLPTLHYPHCPPASFLCHT